jgi:methylated-DNA-[protein]-cysteine S-methyltransferase
MAEVVENTENTENETPAVPQMSTVERAEMLLKQDATIREKIKSGATLDEAAVERDDLPVFRQAAAWLDAYFAKQPLSDLPPLAPRGSDFRQAVWRLLLEIPYGQVTTYGALAQILRDRGISAAAQAVGGAVGHNPISILIHRVVGADGSLTGYAGGVEKKRFLLALEGVDMTNLYMPKRGTAL